MMPHARIDAILQLNALLSLVLDKETHTAEPLVPEPSAVEVELAIEKLKTTNHQVLIKSQPN